MLSVATKTSLAMMSSVLYLVAKANQPEDALPIKCAENVQSKVAKDGRSNALSRFDNLRYLSLTRPWGCFGPRNPPQHGESAAHDFPEIRDLISTETASSVNIDFRGGMTMNRTDCSWTRSSSFFVECVWWSALMEAASTPLFLPSSLGVAVVV